MIQMGKEKENDLTYFKALFRAIIRSQIHYWWDVSWPRLYGGQFDSIKILKHIDIL